MAGYSRGKSDRMYVAYSEDKVYKDVGATRQLFIDDDVVAVVKNVTRRQHSPVKHPPTRSSCATNPGRR